MPKIKQELRQSQNLLISLSMKQAFEVLQMSGLELEEWAGLEIDSNPALETEYKEEPSLFSSSSFLSSQKKAYLESLLSYPASLNETLSSQARFCFQDPLRLQQALAIIEHLDDKGFLAEPLEHFAPAEELTSFQEVLAIIHLFDPVGVGAKNVQEALLIQLRHAKKQATLSYQVILHYYEDLLQGRYANICAGLNISRAQLRQIMETDIALLSPYPASQFKVHSAPPLVPDLSLDYQEEAWKVTLHFSHSHVHLSSSYKHSVEQISSPQERRCLGKYYTQGKWLLRMLEMREETLRKIAHYLITTQGDFLRGEKDLLAPIRVEEMAYQLGIHPSTAARALKNKYLASPRGVLEMKSLFARSHFGKMSGSAVKELLKTLIAQEDKTTPLSDEALKQKLQEKGVSCSRRTITKYRELLKIPPSCKR